jgi:2-haloacid dehalogenase
VKPEPEAYEAALAQIGLPAEEVFFTDDNQANIAAAEAMGFHAHLFDGAQGLAQAMRESGLKFSAV